MSTTPAMVARLRSSAGRAKYRLSELANDRRLGVDTRGLVMPADFDDAEGCHPYLALSYPAVEQVLDQVAVGPEDVFVDVGAGLGRVVLCAATRPFDAAIGVEYSPDLHRRALANVASVDRRRLRCTDVRMVRADAREYRYPDEVTVVFFFMPFAADILGATLDRLHESVERQPRTVRILYARPHDGTVELSSVADDRPWLRLGPGRDLTSTLHLTTAEVQPAG